MKSRLSWAEIKQHFPNQWVLLGNVEMADNHLDVLAGTVIASSRDKRELSMLGRPLLADAGQTKVAFTGEEAHQARFMTGIFRRVQL